MSASSRKIFLGLILVLALLLRLWGLRLDSFFRSPDDFELRLAEKAACFSRGNILVSSDLRYYRQALETHLPLYLTALGGSAFNWLRFLTLSLFFYRTEPGLGVAGFLNIALLISALSGTATVYLIFLIGRHLGGSRNGLLSALFFAVIPLHVAASHLLPPTALSVFFACLSILFALRIARDGAGSDYLLAGLSGTLAAGCHYGAVVVLVAGFSAHSQYCRRNNIRFREMVLNRHLVVLAAGAVTGFLIAFPFLLDRFSYAWRHLPLYLRHAAGFELPGPRFAWAGFGNLRIVTADLLRRDGGSGLLLPLLALVGFVWFCFRREDKYAIPRSFLLAHLLLVLFFKTGIDRADVVIISPFICLYGVAGILAGIDRLTRKRMLRALLLAGGAALVAYPLLVKAVQLDYFLWRQDTRRLASRWIRENFRPGSRIAVEDDTVDIPESGFVVKKVAYIYETALPKLQGEGFDFLVAGSLTSGDLLRSQACCPSAWIGGFYRDLDREGYRLKEFRTCKVDRANPVITIYDLRDWGEDRDRALALRRDFDFDYSESSPDLIMLGESLSCEGEDGFWITRGEKVGKLLIAPSRLNRLGILAFPTRAGSTLKIKAGGRGRLLRFDDPQPRLILLRPRPGFPFIDYSYRVQAELIEGEDVLVKIVTEPGQLSRQLILQGEVEGEGESRAVPAPGNARLEPTVRGGSDGMILPGVLEEDLQWRRAEYSRIFEAERSPRQTGSKSPDEVASGGRAVFFSPDRHRPGYLLFGQYVRLIPRPWVAAFRVKIRGEAAVGTVAQLDVCVGNGREILASRSLTAEDFPDENRYYEFPVSFRNSLLSDRLEFRIKTEGAVELWCDRIEVYPDLAVWLADNAAGGGVREQ